MIGQSLSHFTITAKLGEGGMGEVYRAEDTALGREVAIKVLPEAFVADPERLARFEREAKLLASLNHPNIASIYEVGQAPIRRDPSTPVGDTPSAQDDPSPMCHFLAMELAHGEDLATHLGRGAVVLEEALPIALQVAEALEAAHDRGIVHRDLKPANVMVGPDGAVKVLDFGLAKAWEEGEGAAPDLTASPTLTAQMTQAGVILGTAAYMAPEQARGQEADRRADIWSFGVLLYEMLTGERLFRADTVSDTLARVLMADTDWEAIDGKVPTLIAALLRRCLERDVRQRLQSIGEARIALKAYLRDPTTDEAATPAHVASAGPGWRVAAASLLAGAVVTALVLNFLPSRPTDAPRAVHASLLSPPGVDLPASGAPGMALSPDGRSLVYIGWKDNHGALYRRQLDRFDTQLIPETEDANNPVFSPDGRWLAYVRDRKIWKLSADGGSPHPLAAIESQVWGADWSSDGSIIFNQLFSGLWTIPEQGGEPRMLAAPDAERGEIDLEFPDVLPDGSALIYTAFKGMLPDSAEIGLLDLETGERQTLIENASGAKYLPTGHLIFGRSAGVFLAAFDAERREVTGAPVPAPDGILYDHEMGLPRFATAESGEIVFLPEDGDSDQDRLVSVDLEGNASSLFEAPGNFMYPRFAPDGRSLVVTRHDRAGSHIWIANLTNGALTKLTQEGSNMFPVVHPDGDRVVFYSDRDAGRGIYSIATDGSGSAELLVALEDVGGELCPHDWTPDGTSLIYSVDIGEGETRLNSLRSLEIASGKTIELASDACCGSVSPDGRWLAYMGGTTEPFQAFVSSMTGEGGRQQVSTEGAVDPVWSPDGGELYYVHEGRMMTVRVDRADGLIPHAPRILFEGGEFAGGTYVVSPNFDIAPDGSGFVMIEEDRSGSRTREARLIPDWLSKVRNAVPD